MDIQVVYIFCVYKGCGLDYEGLRLSNVNALDYRVYIYGMYFAHVNVKNFALDIFLSDFFKKRHTFFHVAVLARCL